MAVLRRRADRHLPHRSVHRLFRILPEGAHHAVDPAQDRHRGGHPLYRLRRGACLAADSGYAALAVFLLSEHMPLVREEDIVLQEGTQLLEMLPFARVLDRCVRLSAEPEVVHEPQVPDLATPYGGVHEGGTHANVGDEGARALGGMPFGDGESKEQGQLSELVDIVGNEVTQRVGDEMLTSRVRGVVEFHGLCVMRMSGDDRVDTGLVADAMGVADDGMPGVGLVGAAHVQQGDDDIRPTIPGGIRLSCQQGKIGVRVVEEDVITEPWTVGWLLHLVKGEGGRQECEADAIAFKDVDIHQFIGGASRSCGGDTFGSQQVEGVEQALRAHVEGVVIGHGEKVVTLVLAMAAEDLEERFVAVEIHVVQHDLRRG